MQLGESGDPLGLVKRTAQNFEIANGIGAAAEQGIRKRKGPSLAQHAKIATSAELDPDGLSLFTALWPV